MVRLAFLILAAISQYVYADPDWPDSCNKNQSTINDCAEARFNRSDSELNALYKQQMSYLTESRYKTYLKDAQIAWVKFRDKDCFYQMGPENTRGSMDIYTKYDCMYQHTKRRVDDLKNYISCRENGCPF